MTKIISIIVSIIMLVMTSIFPGFVWPGTETVETGAFLEQVDEAFGYLPGLTVDDILGVEPNNEYYLAVSAAANNDVLVDYETIDVTASVTPEFVATVLVNAAGVPVGEVNTVIENATSIKNVAKVSAAVENGIITLDANNKLGLGAMSADEVTAAIEKAVSLRGTFTEEADDLVLVDGVKTVSDYTVDGDSIVVPASTDIAAGDVYVVEQSDEIMTGAAYKAESVEVVGDTKVVTNSEVAIEDVIEKIDYEGTSDVDFATAMITDGNGEVLSDGYLDTNAISKDDIMKTLKKLANVSFSVKGFKIKAKITDTGLNFSVSKSVCDGVTLSKAYELTNLTVDAKADMNVAKLNFNEVYLKFNYDLKDTTTISGSYAKTFGEEVTTVGEKISGDSFWAKAVNKYALSKLDSTSIKLFTFTLPLGSTPLSITFDVLLNIDVNGRMEIVVVSEEMHGVEIINNKVSTINESTVVDRQTSIYGQFELRLGLDVALGLYGYALVDVGVEGGVGAYVEAHAKYVDANGNPVVQSTLTIPVDYLKEFAAGANTEGEIDISGHADIYGILNVSVGNHSAIGKVGLKKTWTIYDRSNGVFASIDF
ncbi:MAG: hypothetical protein PUJ59_06970 [Clostridiaceae bacterium]|nr:hypothetical protein [Clostridiaceae bacterium]MDY5889510.1 hypothetical protein [Oscillospiraceae bacterium]